MARTDSRTGTTARRVRPGGNRRTEATGVPLARSLGRASIGLGLPLLTVPGRVLRVLGLPAAGPGRRAARLVGARELGAAAGLLTQPQQGAWLWARVAGDAMDLALLGQALRTQRDARRRVGTAMAAVAGVTAVDVAAALRRTRAAHTSA